MNIFLFLLPNILFSISSVIKAIAGVITPIGVIATVAIAIIKFYEDRKNEERRRFVDLCERASKSEVLVRANSISALSVYLDTKNNFSKEKLQKFKKNDDYYSYVYKEFPYIEEIINVIINNLMYLTPLGSNYDMSKSNWNWIIQNRACEVLNKITNKTKNKIQINGKKIIISAIDLRGKFLKEINFDDVDLTGVNLEKAILKDANLRGTKFISAKLNGADLTNADLTGSIIKDSILIDANFRNTKLNNIKTIENSVIDLENYNNYFQDYHNEKFNTENDEYKNRRIVKILNKK